MVNLNRQIGVSQARQGGFSSHVLPEPVGYQPPPSWVLVPSIVDGALVWGDGITTVPATITGYQRDSQLNNVGGPPWTIESSNPPYGEVEYVSISGGSVPTVSTWSTGISTGDIAPTAPAKFTFNVWAGMFGKTENAHQTSIGITAPGILLAASQGKLTPDQFNPPPRLRVFDDTAQVVDSIAPANVIGWHNYELSFDGATYRCFQDGALIFSFAGLPSNGPSVARLSGSNRNAFGTVPKITFRYARYTIGEVLHTTNFTPPQL